MRKTITLMMGLITLLSIASPVLAPPLPQPISGSIFTIPPGTAVGLTVLARNLRTNGEVYAAREGGYYLLEIANIQGGYVPGDMIRIMIIECLDNPVCVEDVQVYGDPIVLNFDLKEVVCLPCPECSPCDSCCPACPTTTTTTPTTITTTTTSTIPEDYCENEGYIWPEDCEGIICDNSIELLVTALLAATAGGFAVYLSKGKLKLNKEGIEKLIEAMPKGCGLRIFRAYSGKSDLKHFHRSPKRYHDLTDRHKEPYDHNGEENLFPNF